MLKRALFNFKTLRSFSIKNDNFAEVKIPVPWGHIAGKWWNPSNQRPVLSLHGWQDNCGTFDRLIPLLNPNLGFLTIDLPGHGLSSSIPRGFFYHNLNYVILVKQIANYFKWPKVSLMGHSLGSITNYMYSNIFPDTVDFIICIDAIKPLYMEDNFPRMGKGVLEFFKFEHQLDSEPQYWPLDLLKQKVASANNNSIELQYVHHILERNVEKSLQDSDKYSFRRDPRLKARIILNWPQKDILEGAKRIKMPFLMIKFDKSGYYENKQYTDELLDILKESKRFEYLLVNGRHHTHLNHPERICQQINDFIAKNDASERTGGGIDVLKQ